MNFGFTEEQDFLRSTAREFLANESPMTRVRELMDDPRGYDPDVWAKMAQMPQTRKACWAVALQDRLRWSGSGPGSNQCR